MPATLSHPEAEINTIQLVARLLFALIIAALAIPVHARDEKITIEVPVFEGGEGKEFFLVAAREYEKVRPDIIVDLHPDPRIADKVRVRILEGTFFEITNAFINYWPLIRNGDVLALDEFLDGPNWEGDMTWRESFLPGTLDVYVLDGKTYGIPFAYFPQVIWYNKKMFREHGWEPPRTWDELFALSEKIQAAGIPAMTFQGRYPYYARPLIDNPMYQLAGPQRWLDMKRGVAGSFQNPEFIESARLVQKLATKYFQQGALGMSHTEAQMQFFNGKVAMIPCGGWLKSEMMGKIPEDFELGSFNIPSVGAKAVVDTSAINGGSNPYFVMAKSKHPREAVDFLRFMTSRTMAAKFSRIQDIPSVIRGASEGNLSRDLSDIVTMMGAAKTTFGSVPGEGYPELEQVWNDAMRRLVTPGATTPEKLAEELEKAAATVRNRAANPDEIRINHVAKPLLLLAALALAAAVAVWSLLSAPRKKRDSIAPVAPLPRMSWINVLIFVGPAAILYAAFVIFPSLRSFSWSLHEWNGLTNMAAMPFKGLLNFRRLLFESNAFWIALSNNLFIMIVVPLFVIPFSLLVASCISRGIVGAKFFRIVFFFPSLLGAVAVALLWVNVYNPKGGLINAVLVSLGFNSFDGFPWLAPDNLYWALIPISIWGACGFNIVLYLAAMESVPPDFYEAATIDGASPLKQFFTITIPLIWDVLAISIVFMVIGGMKAFDLIWLLTNQRPPTESHVVATRMIQTMFDEFRVGEAAAVAVLLFLMVFLGSAATLRIMKRDTVEL